MRFTYANKVRIVYESKSVSISLQKHNKMTKKISFQILIAIKSSAIIENMSLWFDRIQTTWVLKFFLRD